MDGKEVFSVDMLNIMKGAAKLKGIMERVQRELPEKRVIGEAGGGMVAIQMNGKQEILGVFIDERILKIEEKRVIETLVASATNQAVKKSQDLIKEEMKKGMEELNIPGLSSLMNLMP